MTVLPLAFPRHEELSVQTLLNGFFDSEVLAKDEHKLKCDQCKCETDHLKTSSLAWHPDVLILSIKRYGSNLKKRKDRVAINDTIVINNEKGVVH